MIELLLTCSVCPEQYDALDDNGHQVGYLRLRHGHFYVNCPDVGGAVVYEAYPEGDGCFEDDERDYYLKFAVDAIEKWIKNKKPRTIDKPEAPDVEYTVKGGKAGW